MRRIRYVVAASLDGFIAGPQGESDWIIMDPDIDFGALIGQFDTILVGRNTYQAMLVGGEKGALFGMRTFVFSTTLSSDDHPEVNVVRDEVAPVVEALKKESGKDIWLFGGGLLCRSLAALGLLDTVEVAVIPTLLSGGIPLFPPPADALILRLTNHTVYDKTGVIVLEYSVPMPN